MSLLDVIEDFATGDGQGAGEYLVTRRAAATLAKGRFTPGSTTTVLITATVVPYDGKELIVKPEGFNKGDVRKVFSATELLADAGREDVVTISGEAFKVFRVSGPWELDGESHWEALCARQAVP